MSVATKLQTGFQQHCPGQGQSSASHISFHLTLLCRPAPNLRKKHLWPSHCLGCRQAFNLSLFNMHFGFIIVRMKCICDVGFENYPATGTCIIFSQVIAMVIRRAEPPEAWDHTQQWFDLHHRSVLGCCFSSLGAAETEKEGEKVEGKTKNKTNHPSLSFSWSNHNGLLPIFLEVKSNCRQNQ